MQANEVIVRNSRSSKHGVVFQPSRQISVDMSVGYKQLSGFLIKVDEDASVLLTVVYSEDENQVTTRFFPGWNAEWIKQIIADEAVTAAIKIGF